ncbi:MAG: hypothetical protein ACD_2C00260G0001 [uncultured bacterium (gcode 4)]|uniref:Uncharacterized protein n=1 Tax=uncultured bacterium (gcode 4) TaxID=1234023 RepID=K2G151_9BACT|nr:MAG: hypothetical protein ACD_2C00260G0001 [uncultured bacterium (gcode 4)]
MKKPSTASVHFSVKANEVVLIAKFIEWMAKYSQFLQEDGDDDDLRFILTAEGELRDIFKTLSHESQDALLKLSKSYPAFKSERAKNFRNALLRIARKAK